MKKRDANVLTDEKSEKISDKVLFTRIFISFAVIIACLFAMGFSAYAYFSASITSHPTSIVSATYDLVVTPPIGIEKSDTYELSEGEHVFILSCVDSTSSASVGYCKILVKTDANDLYDDNDNQVFYTEPIWNSDGSTEKPNTRSVKISVPQGKTALVRFLPRWGSYSGESISDGVVEGIIFK